MKREGNIGMTTPKRWDLSDKKKLSYQSLYILYLMVEGKIVIPNFLGGNLKYVQEAVDLLEKKQRNCCLSRRILVSTKSFSVQLKPYVFYLICISSKTNSFKTL